MWNARTAPAGMIEVIAPAGFERFFREFVETTAMGAPDPAEIGRLATGALPAAAG